MNIDNYIKTNIELLDKFRENEFEKNNFVENKVELKKKTENVSEYNLEYNIFKKELNKKALINKGKPSNSNKKEYSTSDPSINILEDNNLFMNEKDISEEEKKFDLLKLTIDEKIVFIKNFLENKNIVLDENEFQKIIDIVNNPEINLKKYINISKIYQHITKITFIKNYN
jgi:hypothetical protein